MATTGDTKKPNFLIIVADDLGFSDIGCYGGEIETPNLDALAGEGLRLLNYHTAAACSPTRAMLMSGTDAHLAGLGTMIEYKQNEVGSKRWAGKAGHEGYLNKEVAAIPEVMQDNGYFTAMGGKWHLGMRPDHGPSARGFTRSFSVLPGCCNHFGWEPQLEDGRNAMPMGGRPVHAEDGKAYKVAPNKTEDPKGFFSSNFYTDKLIEYMESRTEEQKAQPFFSFLAFSAPHWPCQSPKAVRDKYRNRYLDGPDELRKRRLSKMKELGIIEPDVVPHEVVAPEVAEWDTFNDYQKACSAASMAAYAGQVDMIDVNVGKIINYLKKTGEYDNTFILFMSDNGAEGAAIEAYPLFGTKMLPVLQKYYNNELENIGAFDSYVWLGPRWAQASTAPSRLYKCFPSEGGILVPCIVKSPRFRAEVQGGSFHKAFTTCRDIAPTMMEMAGISLPLAKDGKKMIHRGRQVHVMRGRSWVPYFEQGKHADPPAGETAAVYADTEVIGWELFARSALRQGKWKIVHLPNYYGGAGTSNDFTDVGEGWELFDIQADPGEIKDLSKDYPEVMTHMLQLWEQFVSETQVVWGPDALVPGLSKEEAPRLHDSTLDHQHTWMTTPSGKIPNIV